MKKLYIISLLAIFGLSITTIAQPTIASFTPFSGPVGTTVTIIGGNFNSTPANNIVFFGATKAVVNTAATTSLNVTVPIGATYQYISVTDFTTNLTAYSSQPFNVTFLCGGGIDASSFATKIDSTTGTNPSSIAIGDLDEDGKSDFVVTNYTSHNVSVFKNTSTSGIISFATKVNFTTGYKPSSVVIGDLNGDGKPELAIVNEASHNVSVFKNTSANGTISFAAKVDYATGSFPTRVAIGDLDGDGKPELAITNSNSNTVSIFINTSISGAISFGIKTDFTTGTSPVGLSISDLDGDGKPDVVVANSSNNTVSVFRSTSSIGNIAFAAKLDFTTGTDPNGISIGDLDGDGKPDLAIANYNSNFASVLKNTSTSGNISFAAKADFTTGYASRSITIGDFDGDGKPDLAAPLGSFNTTICLLKNISTSGTISFETKVQYTSGTNPYIVSLGDLDGDGKPDFVTANYNSSTVSAFKNQIYSTFMTNSSKDTILTGDTVKIPLMSSSASTYTWIATDNPNTTGESITLQTSDTLKNTIINTSTDDQTVTYTVTPTSIACGAATPQIVKVVVKLYIPTITSFTPASGPVGTIVTIIGTNFNSIPSNNIVFFGATKAIVNSVTTSSLNVTVPIGATYQYISVTDITTGKTVYSSKPFIVTFCGGNINASSFAPPVYIGNGSSCVSIGDLDGDGKPDVIATNYSTNKFSALRNTSTNGGVSFTSSVAFTTGTGPSLLSIADLNGDAKLDVAIVNYNANTVSVFKNTSTSGTISFATKIDYATGSQPTQVSINDMDGDGKPDLTIANYGSSNISVLRNNGTSGTISFATKVDFATGGAERLAIGDLDGDGKPDLAVVDNNNPKVSVLKNISPNGAISFAPKIDYATGWLPISVSIGDLDGDSKLDLAVANQNSPVVSIFQNMSTIGAIAFASKVDFPTEMTSGHVAIGDLNGDGKPDLVVAYSNSFDSVSVLKNTSIIGTISFASKGNFRTGGAGGNVSIGDLNGDGQADLVLGTLYGNSIPVLKNLMHIGTAWSPTICEGQSVIIGTHTYTANGTYIDTLTSYQACDSTVTTTLTVNALPTAPIGTASQTFCNTATVANLSATGTAIKWYSAPSGGTALATTTALVTATHYFATQTVSTCESATRFDVTATINVSPAAPTGATSQTFCNNATVANLSATGTAIQWYATSSGGSALTPTTALVNGTHYFASQTIGNCESETRLDITIVIDSLPAVTANADASTICTGNYVTLTGGGASTYIWSGGAINGVAFIPTGTFTYTVTGTDINGCVDTTTKTITVDPLPVLVVTNPAVVCAPNTIDISSSATTMGSSGGTISYWEDSAATVSLNSSYYTVIDTIGTYYIKLDSGGCFDIKAVNVSINRDCVWPGDANHDSIVNNFDLLPIGLYYSQTGSPRTNISNAWQSFLSTNWGTLQTNGSDVKHADCNGDGLIDNNDTLAINLNFSSTHTVVANNFNDQRTPGPDFYFITSTSFYNAGDWVNVEIWLGNSTIPVSNLYGIAFNINYHASLVQLGTESLTYPNSWLGTPGTNAIIISKIDALANTAYGGITRINHTNANGYGKIADFKFQAKASIASPSVLYLSISSYLANDSVGLPQVFNTQSDSITIYPLTTTISKINISPGITISPNPFTNQTTITFNEEQKHTTIKIMDELGKEVKSLNFTGKQLIIEKGEMKASTYFLQISDGNKNVINRKIVLQ